MKFKKKNVSIIKVSYCHQVAYFGKELIAWKSLKSMFSSNKLTKDLIIPINI
jgi:hypothetical protein